MDLRIGKISPWLATLVGAVPDQLRRGPSAAPRLSAAEDSSILRAPTPALTFSRRSRRRARSLVHHERPGFRLPL